MAVAKHFFAKETRTTKAQEEGQSCMFGCWSVQVLTVSAELERLYPAMMVRLREQVIQQLEDERWMYEPVDQF